MITDTETNFVYLSKLLLQNNYKSFSELLIRILSENNVSFLFIENTKDIWCRDYMPVKVNENKFVLFQYGPDYLIGFEHKKSHYDDLIFDFKPDIVRSDLNIDAGNVGNSKTKVILTDKIFKANENEDKTKTEILDELESLFETDKIFIIPHLPDEMTGHADGMLRFIDDDNLIVCDYSKTLHSKSFQQKFEKAISKTGCQIIQLPYRECNEKNNDGDYSAKGCYINFLHVGDMVIMPTFGKDLEDENEAAYSILTKHFNKVEKIESNEVAKDGGVLNCISWTVRRFDPYGVG